MIQLTEIKKVFTPYQHTEEETINEIIDCFFDTPTQGTADTTLVGLSAMYLGSLRKTLLTGVKLKEHYETANQNRSQLHKVITDSAFNSMWFIMKATSHTSRLIAEEPQHPTLTLVTTQNYATTVRTKTRTTQEVNKFVAIEKPLYALECKSLELPIRISPKRLASAVEMWRRMTQEFNGEKQFTLGYMPSVDSFIITELEK